MTHFNKMTQNHAEKKQKFNIENHGNKNKINNVKNKRNMKRNNVKIYFGIYGSQSTWFKEIN